MSLTLLELLLLAAATIPFFRLIAHPQARHRLRRFPLFPLALAFYFIAIILVALFFPPALHVLIVIVGICFLFLFWRSRPDYGTRRGLPPGSLALVPLEPWLDQSFYQKQADRYGPIWKFSNILRPSVGMVGLARGREFLLTHQDALRTPSLPFARLIPGGFLRYTAPEQHDKYRPVFSSAFSSGVVREGEPFMREIVRTHLDHMANDSSGVNSAGVVPRPYCHELVYQVLCGLFFGIAPTSNTFLEFRRLQQTVSHSTYSSFREKEVSRALGELKELLVGHASSTAAPERLPASFLAEILKNNPHAREDLFILYNLVYIFEVGLADLTGLTVWQVQMLCDHPEWGERVRTKPGTRAMLATHIVMETLRLEQSEYILRRTVRPIQFQGASIPKGWQVRVCVHESHRDPQVFESPDEFCPARFRGRQYTRDEYSPFGAHNHTCLGEHLTLSFGRILVEELSCGYSWHATRNGPPESGAFHWRPSSKLRVHLAPLACTPAQAKLLTEDAGTKISQVHPQPTK